MNITISIIDHRAKHVPLWLGMLRWAMFAAILFGPGIAANSAAMQWGGFIILMVGTATAVLRSSHEKLSIPEARERLNELELKKSS